MCACRGTIDSILDKYVVSTSLSNADLIQHGQLSVPASRASG